MLGQHRVAGVDDEEASVAGAQAAQHLGFLRPGAVGVGAVEEAVDAGRGVDAVGTPARVDEVAQAAGVFQAGGVVQFHQRAAVGHQLHALDVAGGAGPGTDFAEAAVAGERAHQRGLAGVGVADDGDGDGGAH